MTVIRAGKEPEETRGAMVRSTVALMALIVSVLFSACTNSEFEGFTFSVMSYNIGNFELAHTTADKIAAEISKHGIPDVLFLQDMPWAISIEDLSLHTGLPYFIEGQALIRRHHIGILSRFPLRNQDVLSFPGVNQRPAIICAEATLGDSETLICSLHLQSPSNEVRRVEQSDGVNITGRLRLFWDELFGETQRSRSVDQLLAWIDAKQPGSVVVGGDFNSFQLSRPIRTMSTGFNDAFWPSWSYFQGTYNGLGFLIKPRLDYIFHSRGIVSLDAKVLTETPGNHFPIRALLRMPD